MSARRWSPAEREARAIAATANLVIFTNENAKGEVINWTVKRRTAPRMTYLGQAVSAEALLRLIKRLARTEETA